VALVPDDDDLLLAYLGAMADSAYRNSDASVLEIEAEPDRQARLALCEALAEYDVHQGAYPTGIVAVFARARELGADEAAWQAAQVWVKERIASPELPDDLWSRYAR
jgi:hypothetical protein